MTTDLAGRYVPPDVRTIILGSLGGAIDVAERAGGVTGMMLAHAARVAFMEGSAAALSVAAAVAFGGALVVLLLLPSRSPHGTDGEVTNA